MKSLNQFHNHNLHDWRTKNYLRHIAIIGVVTLSTACASATQAPPVQPTVQVAITSTQGQSAGAATAIPTRTVLPSLTPSKSGANSQNSQPVSTSALLGLTVTANVTALPTQAALLPGPQPPLDIQLPAGWKAEYYISPIRAPGAQASMNLTRYYGPIQNNGVGTILVLWGFPSLGAPPTLIAPGPTATPIPGATPLDYQSQLLWADGVRLLQGTVVGIACNVGRYEQQTFQIGKLQGIGAYFNVSQCPNEPETVGWFAGVSQNGGNFLFYMYVDPVEAYNEGRHDVQKVLDTVTFRIPSTATPGGPPATNTPQPTPGS